MPCQSGLRRLSRVMEKFFDKHIGGGGQQRLGGEKAQLVGMNMGTEFELRLMVKILKQQVLIFLWWNHVLRN